MLAELLGDAHPVARLVRGLSKVRGVVVVLVWMAVVLVESVLGVVGKGSVVAVEWLCGVLDWVGADY